MSNANTRLLDTSVDRAAMIRLYEERVKGKVSVVIDGHTVRVDKLIRDANLSTKGFNRLRDAIDKEIRGTMKEAYNVSKRSLLDLVSDQVSYTYQQFEGVMDKVWRTQRPQRRIAEEIVLKRPLHADKTLAQGWSGIGIGERKRLEQVIRKGIAEGKGPNEIALAVRKGNVHKITRNQSKALVTTGITSVTSQADHAVYEANEAALQGWQYVAVLDSRTTPICSHRDGHIYPTSDTEHLPPAHFNCRSTTIPVVKSWDDLSKLEGVAHVRKRNMSKLTKKQKQFYDGQTPLKESYHHWLMRQPKEVQYKHLGDWQKVDLFIKDQLKLNKFTNIDGKSIGIRELRRLTDSGYLSPNDTRKFTAAKEKLDALRLGAASPEDFFDDVALQNRLREYYLLQSGELNGTLSLTNYRGTLIGTKKATKNRVLASPPNETQIKFNPVTGRYEDVRLYQPNHAVLNSRYRLVQESEHLKAADKDFIVKFGNSLAERMSVNERAVVTDNLRIMFTRYRKDGQPWANFKAVSNSQMKFDVMNISDEIETVIRRDSDFLKKLSKDQYIDPVLGPTQLDELSDKFIDNIIAKNKWEDKTAPKIARELRSVFDTNIPVVVRSRTTSRDMQQFYLRFAHRLSMADLPDRDQLAVALGRDLYNMANINGNRKKWYETGMKLLESDNAKKFFEVETFGVQKRRMKSRMSGSYFGPYYDTLAYNIRITDPRIQRYAQLTRKVELGLRVAVTDPKNRLRFREGYKTYFVRRPLGNYDTRIPITSTSSFSDFPEEFLDRDMINSLNWASKTKYKIDEDYFDFMEKMLYFKDDKGKAEFFDELNEYRKYIASRGDSYERFKSMQWLRRGDKEFSNHAFIDHRARIYDRGLISPQSGETFRPFLNTAVQRNLSPEDFGNLQDQIGAFLGGLDDYFEGRFNSLSVTGRQKIAEKWRSDLVLIGNHMLRAKPNDIRAVLRHDVVARIEGEELGKFLRFAIEAAKIDNHLKGRYTRDALESLRDFKTGLALEQDASSSGAQIIALTTRNKQLAELSNVVPTSHKRRLYDEIAAATYNDPRFRHLNERLGLTEKDLRKAAKAQNMVTFYGAGERTGIMNVEGKLAKVLGKDKSVLVVKASDRDAVLNEISARIARFEKFDPETALLLRQLRSDVRDVFNKGIDPGDDIMEQLFFLDPKTRELVEQLSHSYTKVVTPADFRQIATIMSDHLAEQVPILKDFTRFFGRLAEDYLANAKPSSAAIDWVTVAKLNFRGASKKGLVLPDRVSELLGMKPGEPIQEKVLKGLLDSWRPNGFLSEIIFGIQPATVRRTGLKGKLFDIVQLKDVGSYEILYPNKLPKSWTNVPWVNFDGKIIEQNFTQSFEERIIYKDRWGNWVTNILQIPQKTEATWWEQVINKSGKINDIADATKARTAFAVNGNHSNDAVIVKQFHLWGQKTNTGTSTIHDAFFTNIGDMLPAKRALRGIYADALERNVILDTLNEMRNRGLPKSVYDAYLKEAYEKGLIPKVGTSRVGGKLITEQDILKTEDILRDFIDDFETDYDWYGIGP